MGNPITNRLIKAEVRFTWNSQQVENVLHFTGPQNVPSSGDLDDLATVIDNSVLSDWLDLMAATVTYREVYCESYQGPASLSRTLASGGVGLATGNSMAGNNTLCLSFRTPFTGRRRRGRFYTIGMSEEHQAAGEVTAAYRNAWLAAMNTLMSDAATAGFDLVVASFADVNLPIPGPVQITNVNAIIVVDDYCDSQRRRLQGRGA